MNSQTKFFEFFYRNCEGKINIRPIPGGNEFYSISQFIPEQCIQKHKGKNLYFGVATRDGQGGGKQNIVHIPALFIDVDLKETPREALIEHFKAIPLKPSAIVETGGGFHLYWKLKEPLEKDGIPEFENYLLRMATYFEADLNAIDASRILRVPGSQNHKYKPPKTVILKQLNPDLQYKLEDFDFLPEAQKSKTQEPKKPNEIPEPLRGVSHGNRNATCAMLAGHYLARRLPKEEIAEILLAWNLRNRPPLSEEEIVRTVESVYKTDTNNHPTRHGKELQGGNGHSFVLVKASDILNEPDEETQWIWEGVLPQAGMSLIVAKPKIGKTTFARNLAGAVAGGKPFLGRNTVMAPVVYLALEEKRGEIRKSLKALNFADEPLFFHFGLAPKKAIEEIPHLVAETGAGLLVVDTLQKLARIRDLNDYALVTNTLEPLLMLARERNCHIVLTHHAGKADRNDGDEILGSTGLLGGVDTAIILKKRNQRRTFSTIQRYGDNVPETVILLNEDCSLSLGGTLVEARKQEIWDQIKSILDDHPGLTEPEIVEETDCRKADASAALRWALDQNQTYREGAGKRGDPFRYFLPPVPPVYTREGENQKQKKDLTVQNHSEGSPSQISEYETKDGREKKEFLEVTI
ncbi:MAG: AAA family ATPase [candidate division Zixibacteria bacterium]|nr:AAA family ATPase [candidate division Zixibacteria bacterium]